MPKVSALSTTQQISIVAVVLAFPLLFVVTRAWPTSVAAVAVPFLYPIAVVFLMWSLAKTEARTGPIGRQRVPVANIGLGLSAPPPTRLGRGGMRSITGEVAFLMLILLSPGTRNVFPQGAGFSEAFMLAYWGWWVAACAFIAFGLPRLVRRAV